MQLKSFVLAIFAVFAAASLSAQVQFKLSDWKLYSSLHNVVSADIDKSGRIWAGTTGGLFVYDESQSKSYEFNSLNGLLSNDVSCVFYDANSNNVIVGLNDGAIDIFSEDMSITHITSIRDERFANPSINKIIAKGDMIYIAGGFGIAVFDIRNKVFVTTIAKIGNWTKNQEINDIAVYEDKMWVASSSGVASCPFTLMLEVPTNWKTYSSADGFVQTEIHSLNIISNQLIATAKNQSYLFDGESFSLSFSSELDLLKAFEVSGRIIYLTIYNAVFQDYSSYCDFPINSLVSQSSKSREVLLTKSGLVFYSNGNTLGTFLPNTPKHNLFGRVAIDTKGDIWAVSAHFGAKEYQGGISQFSNGSWKNYNKSNFPVLLNDNFFEMELTASGKLIASSFGTGVVILDTKKDELQFEMLTPNNSEFVGLNGGDFLVVGGYSEDPAGTLWFTNFGSMSIGTALLSIDKDGNRKAYNNCFSANERRILRLVIDNYGTKWYGSYPGEGRGIFYFNERNTPNDISDDRCGMISTSTHTSLADNSPNVMRKDQYGNIWLGFGQGVSVIRNPQSVISGANVSVISIRSLNGMKVNDILIDPVGYVWVATSAGVRVLQNQKNNIEEIANITKDNSKLADNNVVSLAADFNTGTIYFGTENGLYSAKTLSVLPNDSYDIICYPQPFNLNKNSELTIDGLTADSEISIVTINGELVRNIKAQGKKAIWDGKNFDGKPVASGIYLVVSNSVISNSGSVQKIAVIGK